MLLELVCSCAGRAVFLKTFLQGGRHPKPPPPRRSVLNLSQSIKTLRRAIFATAPPRKNYREFLRKRSGNEAHRQTEILSVC